MTESNENTTPIGNVLLDGAKRFARDFLTDIVRDVVRSEVQPQPSADAQGLDVAALARELTQHVNSDVDMDALAAKVAERIQLPEVEVPSAYEIAQEIDTSDIGGSIDASDISVDASDLSVDASEINVDESCIDVDESEIASNIDMSDVASEVASNVDMDALTRGVVEALSIDASDIARHIDASDIGNSIDVDASEVGDNISVDAPDAKIDHRELAKQLVSELVSRLSIREVA